MDCMSTPRESRSRDGTARAQVIRSDEVSDDDDERTGVGISYD